MVYPRIGVSYGEWLNGTHDPCDEEHCDMIGTVQHHLTQGCNEP